MLPADLPAVMAVAAQLHPDYPEDQAVFAERLRHAPAGCHCLMRAGAIVGYMVSHPWLPGDLPALNSLLGAIPASASLWYIHDLAILPQGRGGGAAGAIVAQLTDTARLAGCIGMALVAVNDSVGFWERQGFRVAHDPALAHKLASYDDAARYMLRQLNS